MNRLDWNQELPEGAEQAKNELIHVLGQDKDLLSYFHSRGIPFSEIKEHPYRIERWIEEKRKCFGCKGVSSCVQKQKGYCEELRFNDYLDVQLEPCKWWKEKNEKEKHLSSFLINDMPGSFHQVSFSAIDVSAENDKYKKVLSEAMKSCFEGHGVYLYGNMGTGKTYLASCAANYYASAGKSAAFVHCPKFADRLMAGLRTNEYKTEMQRLCYADAVVFDDIGAEEVTDRYRSLLLAILDDRMQNSRITWFTSNEDFPSLQDHYTLTSRGADLQEAERILERIRVLAKPLALIGTNRRKSTV